MSHFASSNPAALQPDRHRGAARAPVRLRGEVRQGTRPWQLVVLDDLSPQGFRISGLRHVDPAQPVAIRLPGLARLTARVCWSTGKVVGCEFLAPLHVAVFDHLVRQARSG